MAGNEDPPVEAHATEGQNPPSTGSAPQTCRLTRTVATAAFSPGSPPYRKLAAGRSLGELRRPALSSREQLLANLLGELRAAGDL